jgi:hypothetical protein
MLRQKSERLENAAAERSVGISDALLDGNQVLRKSNHTRSKLNQQRQFRSQIALSATAYYYLELSVRARR